MNNLINKLYKRIMLIGANRNKTYRSGHGTHIFQIRLRLRIRYHFAGRGQKDGREQQEDRPGTKARQRYRSAHSSRVHREKGKRFNEEGYILESSEQADEQIRELEDRQVGSDIRERVFRGRRREELQEEAIGGELDGVPAKPHHTLLAVQMGSHNAQPAFP